MTPNADTQLMQSTSSRWQVHFLFGQAANLEDPLFTPGVRAAGLVQLANIQSRLLTVPTDPQAILRDPWY